MLCPIIPGQGARKRSLQNHLAQEVLRRRLVRQRRLRLQGIEQVHAVQHRITLQEHERLETEQAPLEEASKMPSEKITLPPSEMIQRSGGQLQRVNTQTVEERVFQVALMYMESYFTQQPPMGVKTATKSRETIKRTMEKTLNSSQVRYAAAHQHGAIDLPQYMSLIFAYTERSLRKMLISGSVLKLLLLLLSRLSQHVQFVKPTQRPYYQASIYQKVVLSLRRIMSHSLKT
jgi:hypothetical protein